MALCQVGFSWEAKAIFKLRRVFQFQNKVFGKLLKWHTKVNRWHDLNVVPVLQITSFCDKRIGLMFQSVEQKCFKLFLSFKCKNENETENENGKYF